MNQRPWAAFCISTFKRPEFLRNQIALLLQQTFRDFEVVISDNDPLASAKEVASQFSDARIRYFHNRENLGMIRSFNKSIERSTARYIVMVTDDDPVETTFLAEMQKMEQQFPGYSLYAGFIRKVPSAGVEVITSQNFIPEILHPVKTPWLLWSSAIIDREAAISVNMIPDYGSPHLADHALIAFAGSVRGGVIINKKFSSLTSHETNFSKFNFEYYTLGCKGFYNVLDKFCQDHQLGARYRMTVIKHLESWFIANIFNLKRYYSVRRPDKSLLDKVDECASEILSFPFMKTIIFRYKLKTIVFELKKRLGLLK